MGIYSKSRKTEVCIKGFWKTDEGNIVQVYSKYFPEMTWLTAARQVSRIFNNLRKKYGVVKVIPRYAQEAMPYYNAVVNEDEMARNW